MTEHNPSKMSGRAVRTQTGERLDVGGFHQPGGGYVLLGDSDQVHTLDIDNARWLTVALLVALADALGEDGDES